MTNNSKNSKVLKSLMIGTIALTPVLATDVGVVKAAATGLSVDEKQAIGNFVDKFNALNSEKQELVRIVMNVLAKNPAESIESTYLQDLKGPYENLLTTTTGETITTDKMETRYIAFKTAVRGVKEDVTSEELVDYYTKIINGLVTAVGDQKLNSGNYNDLLGSGVYGEFQKVYEANPVPPSLKPVIKVPSLDILSGIQSEFNKYLASLNTGGSGGGGIIPPTPPVTGEGSVEVDGSTITSNPQAVIDSINNADAVKELAVKVPAGATNVDVPATILNALDNKNNKAVVALQFGEVSYELPVNAFDLSAAATDLDVASAELNLVVSVTKVDNPLKDKAAYKVLADAIDFEVKLVAPNDKSVTLSVFPTLIKRSLPAASTLNPLTTVGVTVDANGKVTAVPTYVSGDKSANLYRSTNSVYTLIEYSKSFADLTGGTSWAGEYVDKLASRMVVNGKTDTTFAPTLKITRGEFAAILSRGLGIVAVDPAGTSFKDVSTKQAFNQNGEISAVVEAGIVAGYKDGTFRPYEEITRDQAAIMISRAIDYVGADKVTFDKKKALTAFKDNKQIGAASRNHVERVYQAGLLDGYQDDTFRPNADANRAQMAKIIYNFLAEIEFIN